MLNNLKISPAARIQRIREMLADQNQASIGDMARLFAVSEMTIRRDLDKLASKGQIQRTHGGAVPAERMAFEFDFHLRRQARKKEKQAIARAAATLIQPGQRIILDTGTTTLELASLLRDHQGLTIITPSLAVASVLQFSPGLEVVLLGGVIRRGSPDLTGSIAENNLGMFSVDVAFTGADGIGLDGALYSDDLRIAQVDQLIRKRASRSFVLADSSKIGKTALAVNGYVQEVDGLITDDHLAPEHHKILTDLGAKLTVVEN